MAGKEGVLARVAFFDRDAARLVEDGEPEVEAAEELDEPLVGERLGYEDQGARGASGRKEALEDEAGLDGLAEADLVGEEHARDLAPGDLLQDVELVRDEVDAAAKETADVGLPEAVPGAQGAEAQVEDLGRIRLAGEETLGGGPDAGDVGDHVLAGVLAAAGVNVEAVFVGDGLDDESGAVAGGDAVTGVERDALQHRGTAGVDPALPGGGELDGDASVLELRDEAQTQLRLTFAQASLSDNTQ